MFFTTSGVAPTSKVYEIPEWGGPRGRSIAISGVAQRGKIAATIRVQAKKSGMGANIVVETWDKFPHRLRDPLGIVKKSNLPDYSNVQAASSHQIETDVA
jgi:hypothetical protein